MFGKKYAKLMFWANKAIYLGTWFVFIAIFKVFNLKIFLTIDRKILPNIILPDHEVEYFTLVIVARLLPQV